VTPLASRYVDVAARSSAAIGALSAATPARTVVACQLNWNVRSIAPTASIPETRLNSSDSFSK
jgi:hypothetical protein